VFDRVRQIPEEEYIKQKNLALLEQRAELVKTFNPYQPDYNGWFSMDEIYSPAGETLHRKLAGPLIKIYKLPYKNQPFVTVDPNFSVPLEANFDGKLTLLGYDLPARHAEAGGGFPITLFWRVEDNLDQTYIVFNRLLDSRQNAWGGYDRLPQEVADTALWYPGEIVMDAFHIPIRDDTPDGIYTIDIGLYNQVDQTAQSLQILENGQPIEQTSVRIGPVKVGKISTEPVLPQEQVKPRYPVSVKLGEPSVILLRGYDLSLEKETARLTVYWESLEPTSVDWSIFAHIRNQTGETVAQKDGPAGGSGDVYYPSSLWGMGEVIADEVIIPLPNGLPPGEYSLVIGLYDLTDGTRLTVPHSINNEIELDALYLPN
jgi:hypothetical protein